MLTVKKGTTDPKMQKFSSKFANGNFPTEKISVPNEMQINSINTGAKFSLQSVSSEQKVKPLNKSLTRVSLEFHQGKPSTVFAETPNGFIAFSHNHPFVPIAEVSSPENELMIIKQALQVKSGGAKFLRFSRTSPDYFSIDKQKARQLFSKIRGISHLGIVTEVSDTAHLQAIAEVSDIIQVTSKRNNMSLLKQLGKIHKPILLKRDLTTTIKNWLIQAEQILAAGNPDVILCERETEIFNQQGNEKSLDLSTIPVLRQLTHLPIVIDSSDNISWTESISTITKAAITAGISSLIISVQPNPVQLVSHQPKSLTLEQYQVLMQDISEINHTSVNKVQNASL